MSEDTERILRFPDDRAVGYVSLSANRQIDTKPAIGSVDVPAGSSVTLQVMSKPDAPDELPGFVEGDLAGLKQLGAKDLDALFVINVSGESLQFVSHLTGLSQLSLTGKVTDDGLKHLATLESLFMLSLDSSNDLGDGLRHLAPLSRLKMFVLKSGLRPEGIVHLQALENLDYLLLTTKITSELIDAMPPIPKLETLVWMPESIDREALLKLPAQLPSLKALSVKSAADESLLDAEMDMELRRRFPHLTINGTWYAEKREGSSDSAHPELNGTSGAKPVPLSSENFDQIVGGEIPVLVDFWAEWCGPCKLLDPIMSELAKELAGRMVIAKVDVDSDPQIAAKFNVKALPVLLVLRKGELVARVGSRDKRGILEQLESIIT